MLTKNHPMTIPTKFFAHLQTVISEKKIEIKIFTPLPMMTTEPSDDNK
jgi:hypothetical protein